MSRYYICTNCSTRSPNPEGRDFVSAYCNLFNSAHYFFAVLDLQKQMEVVLSDETISTALFSSPEKRCNSEGAAGFTEIVLEDKTDGAPHTRKIGRRQQMGINLTTNTDGVKVFNRNKTSLWPVQCVINELRLNALRQYSPGWTGLKGGTQM